MASFGGVEVVLSLPEGYFVLALSGMIGIVVESSVALLLLFAIDGVRVGGDNGDLAPLGRPVIAGWEDEKHNLELRILPWGRVGSDLIRVRSDQICGREAPAGYSKWISVDCQFVL